MQRFHVMNICEHRMVACRFDHCPAVFPKHRRDVHERQDCLTLYTRRHVLTQAQVANTCFPCRNCAESVRQRDMHHHLTQLCGHRKVYCPRADCRFSAEVGQRRFKQWQRLRAAEEEEEREEEEEEEEEEKDPFARFQSQRNPQQPSEAGAADEGEGAVVVVEEEEEEEEVVGAPKIPIHLLQHHMLFECASAEYRMHNVMVERARMRINYPRPWGIHINVPVVSAGSLDSSSTAAGAADAGHAGTASASTGAEADAVDAVDAGSPALLLAPELPVEAGDVNGHSDGDGDRDGGGGGIEIEEAPTSNSNLEAVSPTGADDTAAAAAAAAAAATAAVH